MAIALLRMYDRRELIEMIKDLVNITNGEIEESVAHCTDDDNTVVMYLQNNGVKDYEWSNSDMNAWLFEDLDD